MNKWWIYQKEMFPLAGYVPMMFAFGFSSVSYSLHLANYNARLSDLSAAQIITAMITTLSVFMLMRIADEHKDYREDMEFRPYRPVPRGLVTLKELRRIGAVLTLVQIALSIWVDIRLLGMLFIVNQAVRGAL